MPSKAGYGFRAVTRRDLPLLKLWAETPHWREHWGEPDKTLAGIEAALDDDAVEPLIAELDGAALAYVQVYDPHLEDDHPYQDQPTGTLGVDLSIGEAGELYQGHGPALLSALAEILFGEGAPQLIIDPDPDNAAAISAYGKAGFRAFGRRTTIYGPALMMALINPDTSEDA